MDATKPESLNSEFSYTPVTKDETTSPVLFKAADQLTLDSNGLTSVSAPNTWTGRLVSWVKSFVVSGEPASNMQVKEAIVAKIKSNGVSDEKAISTIMDSVLGSSYCGIKTITGRSYNQIMTKVVLFKMKENQAAAAKYLEEKASLPETINKEVFLKELSSDPDYKTKQLGSSDFDAIAGRAMGRFNLERQAKLEEAFPNLSSELTVTTSPQASLKQLKEKATTSEATKNAIDAISLATSLRAEMHFDPAEAQKIQEKIAAHQTTIQKCQKELLGKMDRTPLEDALFQELGTQSARLTIKSQSLTEYIKSDPFTDKNVLRPRLINAMAARQVATQVIVSIDIRIAQLEEVFSPENSKQIESLKLAKKNLSEKVKDWCEVEVGAYSTASDTRSKDPKFYKSSSAENPIRKYTQARALKELKALCKAAAVPGDITASLSKSGMKEAALKVMNEEQDWNITTRTMVASLNGTTRNYKQISVPISQGETAVAAEMKTAGIKGIVPGSRGKMNQGVAINARTTTLEQLGDNGEKGEVLHKRQQHGIVDHFEIEDPRHRAAANEASARQLIQAGIEADPEFIKKCLADGDKVATVVYSNTNLTTPTRTNRGAGHDERLYSENQAKAFKAVCGEPDHPTEIELVVCDPSDPKKMVSIKVKVVFVDARFPVNYALDDGFKSTADQALGGVDWKELHEHNEKEFSTLFGSTVLGEPIGGAMKETYDALTAKAEANDPKAKKLKADIDKQCSYVRAMFNNEDYKSAKGDRFKMPRHIDLLNNAFRRASELLPKTDGQHLCVINAGGCMSGKDREGVDHAEAEAAIVIEDHGGDSSPGHGYTDEERTVYNTFVNGVVDNTLQVTGFGGSKNAKEVAGRIQDKDALTYAAGLSSQAKT